MRNESFFEKWFMTTVRHRLIRKKSCRNGLDASVPGMFSAILQDKAKVGPSYEKYLQISA